ncbi:MAG: ATPase P [Thermodesulfobacterium geofontis]|uniref:ATPase P n=1 Tax=Thermodesulfobacterium geofontis TaxID=1295609 RepID=A0A2N7PQF0_9BACT|nr:MAG: ATPase P [Thermodesulfobacterium geofontis]
MLEIEIPGRTRITLKYLVSDFTGTLSVDGNLVPGVKEKLNLISQFLEIYILTADTFGKVKEALKEVKVKIHFLDPGNEDIQKENFVKALGSEYVIALGNGKNDRKMVKIAKIGVAVMLEEGCAVETLLNSDILVKSPLDALDLILNPKRLIAVLRS